MSSESRVEVLSDLTYHFSYSSSSSSSSKMSMHHKETLNEQPKRHAISQKSGFVIHRRNMSGSQRAERRCEVRSGKEEVQPRRSEEGDSGEEVGGKR
ncbi:hypothetical protein E2C01_011506 [Portunus trituberculatus]|uniref:Uncharacterized protein n=1 Tax=Portunus trituberculatus TaxID=210409 RepID=A0A5B7DBM4_PORTR|nr:hypothetical protein [Portunus trituberculatus]